MTSFAWRKKSPRKAVGIAVQLGQ